MPADRNGGTTKREAARQRIAERRAREAAARAAAERRRRTLIGGGVAAVLVVIAVVIVVAIQTSRTSTSASAPLPAHTVDNGLVIPVGQASAPVTVDLYEDFQCPNCRNFEAQTGSTLTQLVDQGKVKLRYHVMAFLDNSTNNRYSTRAANAAAVVTNAAGDAAFEKFHGLLYANQPPETGNGLSDQQLIQYAAQAGASGPQVQQAITGLKYGDWVKKSTDQASKDGVTGTPTVLVNGQQLTDLSPAGLTAAVNSAKQ